MSNSDLFRVRSCRTDWIIHSQLYEEKCWIDSPNFRASDDTYFSWYIKLQRDTWNGNFNSWYVSVKSMHTLDPNEIWNRGSVAGKATIKIKPVNSNGETKDCEISFVTNEKDLQLPNGRGDHFMCRYDQIVDSESSKFDMKMTCEVSYLYLNDALPFLISDRYITCPVEKYQFIQAADRGVFQEMYLSEKFSDVVLCVNGTDYHAHKIVLTAHSKVFKAMFQHDDLQENQLNRVEIKDIDESAFLQALRFMYFGRVEDAQALAYDLLPVADRYDIEELKTSCETILSGSQLSVENVVRILLLAESYNVEELKKRAIEFLTNHSKAVAKKMNSKEWEALTSRPGLTKDLLCLFFNK